VIANHVGELGVSTAQADNIQVPPGEDISERLTMVAPISSSTSGIPTPSSSEDGVCVCICVFVGCINFLTLQFNFF